MQNTNLNIRDSDICLIWSMAANNEYTCMKCGVGESISHRKNIMMITTYSTRVRAPNINSAVCDPPVYVSTLNLPLGEGW